MGYLFIFSFFIKGFDIGDQVEKDNSFENILNIDQSTCIFLVSFYIVL